MRNLDKIFKPNAIAVIGASAREGSVGNALIRNLIAAQYPGPIYPVNPRHNQIEGRTCYAAAGDIEEPVDLAIITTPLATSLPAIESCIAAGVGGLIIISAGGKEAGDSGRVLEGSIAALCRQNNVRVIGPNCVGIISTHNRLNATFTQQMPKAGKLAVISQSGALCTAMLDIAQREGMGFSHFISVGTMLDADFGDLIDYLGQDPKVGSIVLYIENIPRMRAFMSAARRVSRIKPIVALKAGRTPAGARAAASHTGALTGEDAVYEAAFKRAGLVRVDTFEDLFDCAELMAKQPLPKGKRIAVLTNGGGAGVMAADALGRHNLEPAPLSETVFNQLNDLLPSFWSRNNPIDILGDADPGRWRKAVEICLACRELDALIIIFLPQALTDAVSIARAVIESLAKRRGFPVFAVWMGSQHVDAARNLLNQAGVPTYETPERAVSAFVHMHDYARNQEMLREIPPKFSRRLQFEGKKATDIIENVLADNRSWLSETEAKQVLQAYGVPVVPTYEAATAAQAVQCAERAGYPVVLKIWSDDITHKTDAGGVRLNLPDAGSVRQAFDQLTAAAQAACPGAVLKGVSVQPMIGAALCELIVGAKSDADFGPVLLFGMGGIMAEILRDTAIGLPPLNRLLARRLMQSTRIYRFLKGFRNRPAADLDQLEEILVRVSRMVSDLPHVQELDINPLMLTESGALVADARMLVAPPAVEAPFHLAIRPYPNQYETTATSKTGESFFVRPIMPEDAPLLVDFFKTLSPRSVYNRFFRPIKELSEQMLAMLTQIDYDRDMALTALDQAAEPHSMLGMARIISDPDITLAEFAVLVGDPWQGKGVGASLLRHLLDIALDLNMQSIWGYVLAENTQMLALGRKLGFDVKRGPEAGQYEMRIALDQWKKLRDKNGMA